MASRRKRAPLGRALLITGVYLAIGTGWILGSDRIAFALAGEESQLASFQTIKGIIYVLLTAAGLFYMIRAALVVLKKTEYEVRAETDARLELERYLSALIRAVPVGVADFDAEGRVLRLWNPEAERLFGLTAEEVRGTVPPIFPEPSAKLVEQLRESVAAGQTISMVEIDLIGSDGKTFPAAISAAPVVHGNDVITVVIFSDMTERHDAMNTLRDAVDEREVLVREIHHRVKNNLQIISSLLVMERRESGDQSEAGPGLTRALSRIRTIARIHEQLYRGSDLAHIDLGMYLRELSEEIASTYGTERWVSLERTFDSIPVSVDLGIPIGLILHELLVNAYQHAFAPGASGTIRIDLASDDDGFELVVRDNGVGRSLERAAERHGIGVSLVEALVTQVGGEMSVTDGDGTEIRIRVVLTGAPVTK